MSLNTEIGYLMIHFTDTFTAVEQSHWRVDGFSPYHGQLEYSTVNRQMA